MEWKKVFVQAAISLAIGLAGVLVAIGVFTSQVESTRKTVNRITMEQLPAIELRVERMEVTLAAVNENDAANIRAHESILRELDQIQTQLRQIQIHMNQQTK